MRIDTRGFGTVEVLLIIIVVGILGLGGYVVYSNQQNDKENAALSKKLDKLETKQQTTPSSKTESEAKSEDDQIREAAGCKTSSTDCTIKDKTKTLAWVQVSDGYGGANYYVAKENDTWVKIYSGNGDVPQAIIDKYQIPEPWLGPSMDEVQ